MINKAYNRLKIPTEKGSYYKGIWLVLEDGGSDRWLWVCRDSLAYIFICIDDMVAACGAEADYWFHASVSVVDLLTIPVKTMHGAIESCGYDGEIDMKVELDRLRMAEMLHSVGAKAPMWQDQGCLVKDRYDTPSDRHPAFTTLRANARKYAEENLFNDEERNKLLDTTIINAIGETARENMQGTDGMWAAMRRIKDAGEAATPEQQLVLKMYRGAGTTLGAGPVPKDIMEE